MSTTIPLSNAKRLLLERRLRGEGTRPRPETDNVRPRPPGVRVPISPEQGHVWLHATLAAQVPLYNEPITIHRRGPFDLAALQCSFNELLRRHEAWRTSFALIDGEVLQVVHPALHVDLPLVDLSALPRQAAEQEALRIAAADARSPISMAVAPLFRAKVVRLNPDEHRLHLTVHHIIFDGVSVYRVLMPELAALYEAFAAGRSPSLPEPALQYGDYAIWRRRPAAQEEFAPQLQHWRRELGGELPALQLPFDRPRQPVATHRGAIEVFSIPAELATALHAVSRAEGVTLYMTLLAAFKTLLFRYSGQEDIIIGGVTDARRRPELERLIGYFLNPIALRTQPAAGLPFRNYLMQVRDAALGALGASDVPFDQVVRELHIRRDPAYHPVFTVFFSIQPPVDLVDPAWDLTQMDVGSGTAKFDIYFELEERAGGISARFIYNVGLFDAGTMQRMAAHYLTVLRGIVDDAGCTLGSIPVLTRDELQLQCGAWNRTVRPSPQTTLHGMFEEQAQRSPQAPAVACEGHAWTYAELDREADRIAAWLRAAGVAPGQLVGLCIERSLDMAAGVLAILKSGAAYLPLDPALPPARLGLTISDAGPALVLTRRSLASALPAGVPVLLFDDMEADGAIPDRPATSAAAGPDDLAYVIYTSGTTGRPKGVEVPHRAVVNEVAGMGEAVECWAGDIVLAVAPLSFDPATLDLFMPLACGAQVVIASREAAADPYLLSGMIQRSGCTIMQATPTTWRRLVERGWTGSPGLKALCGGEALPRDLADALLSRGARLWNVYGPTETTIWATVHEVDSTSGAVPIGRPIANVTTAIFDAQGNYLPVGAVGELHIGGAGVARGYRNREELTRERFTIRPILGSDARLYRTGDMARYRPDGVIEFLGRRDHQVKVRGFRVELEEVEGAISGHPNVAGAAVRAGPDSSGEIGLTAYIVARSGPPPTGTELRAFLKAMLPDYMVPSAFVTLDALPQSSTGKLDRKALPEPAPRAPSAVPDEPQNEWERRVARIWAEVLGVGSVGRHDDFFDLGGHSILVAKLQQRIVTEFGRTLSLAALFQAQTVAAMARALREQGGDAIVRPSQLLQVQPAGSLPPLYWIEPTPSVRYVADALGREQPLLGLALDAADLDALGEQPGLEAMAGCMVRTLLEVDPVGPYNLIGICNKGVLAFEVASQLAAAGHTVATLVIVDAVNPAAYRRTGSLAVELSKLRFHVAAAWRQSGRDRFFYALTRTLHLVDRVVPLKSVPKWDLPVDVTLARAVQRYAPKPYPGDVVLLQAAERPDRVDTAPGWARVVTGTLVGGDAPGTHETLLEPRNVDGLAAAIRDALAR